MVVTPLVIKKYDKNSKRRCKFLDLSVLKIQNLKDYYSLIDFLFISFIGTLECIELFEFLTLFTLL